MGLIGMTRIVGKVRDFLPLPQCIGTVGFNS